MIPEPARRLSPRLTVSAQQRSVEALGRRLEVALARALAELPLPAGGVELAIGLLGGAMPAPRAAHAPLIPLQLDGPRVVVGPFGEAPCGECLRLRWAALRFPQQARAMRRRDCLAPDQRWLAGAALDWLAGALSGIVGLVVGEHAGALARTVFVLDLRHGTCTRHGLVEHDGCPRCAARAPVERLAPLQSRAKATPGSLRLRDAVAVVAPHRSSLVNPTCGAASRALAEYDQNELTTAVVGMLPGTEGSHQEVSCGGYSDTIARSAAAGVLEALERQAGLACDPRRIVQATLSSLGDRALDPGLFGAYAKECYERDRELAPFARDRPIGWVAGVSLISGREVLVPEQIAFYGRTGSRFVYSNSSGCASGSCLEEAILHALFELVERDAFLLAWYARRSLVPLALPTIPDALLAMKCARARRAGYAVYLCDARHDLAIPVVLAVLERDAAITIGLGASLDPVAAAHAALGEAMSASFRLAERIEERREALLAMALDPRRVEAMPDHALLYGLPAMAARAAFLFASAAPRPFADVFGERPPLRADDRDLLADLRRCVARVHEATRGDVVVVEQTTREQRALGIRCARVLAPGLLPLDFGHLRSRVAVAPRLAAALRDGDGRARAMNEWPHPFA